MATEKRLIDANYLVNKMIRNCPIEEGGIPLGDFDKHQKILELYPTVDAVEVVHGRMRHVFFSYQSNHYECTCCGGTFLTNSAPHWNYCPNCGAKMDGDGNG